MYYQLFKKGFHKVQFLPETYIKWMSMARSYFKCTTQIPLQPRRIDNSAESDEHKIQQQQKLHHQRC